MADQPLVPAVIDTHEVSIIPLKGNSDRADWYVEKETPTTPAQAPDFVEALTKFFDGMDQEIDRYVDDPVATSQALARIETILADIRYIQKRLRKTTAESMQALKVRRLVVQGVSVVEASSSIERKNWRHGDLIKALLAKRFRDVRMVDNEGEVWGIDVLGELLDALYGPSTSPRITPIKDAKLDPHDFCDVATDEQGKTIRTPSVQMVTNDVRNRR